jgi:colicin import membrane protein
MQIHIAGFLRCSMFALAAIGTASASCAEATDKALRERLSTERREVERDFAAQERECAQRFLVTACVDDAKAQRRDALKRLSTREAALDDAERTRRAAVRQQRLDAKLARQARDREERASAPLIPFEPASAAIRTPSRAVPLAPAAVPPIDDARRRADEQRSRTEYETRQRQVEARQQAAALRQARRDGSRKPPAAPLPPIGGASAP